MRPQRCGAAEAIEGFRWRAQIHQRLRPVQPGFRQVGPQRQRPIAARHRIPGAAQHAQGIGAVRPAFGILRRERERRVVAHQRLRSAAKRRQRNGPVGQGCGMGGHVRQHHVIGRDRRRRLPQHLQRQRLAIARLEMPGLHHERPFLAGKRSLRLAKLKQGSAAIGPHIGVIGSQRDGRAISS